METQTVLSGGPDFVWNGMPADVHKGNLDAIAHKIPWFRREPFTLGVRGTGKRTAENALRDVIVRLADAPGTGDMPVAVVSKTYTLLQHAEVLRLACEAVAARGVKLKDVQAELEITRYGERMKLALRLPPHYHFIPGDGFPLELRLICLNSVDQSMGFRALVAWHRLICSNGMIVGTSKAVFRRNHTRNFDVLAIGPILSEGLLAADTDRKFFLRWLTEDVSEPALRAWIDGPVTAELGVLAATRAYHIALRGRDVRLARPFEKGSASQKTVEGADHVEGAVSPADNKYAVSQVLSWLASRRNDPAERVEWMEKIPRLMEKLAPSLN